MTRKKDNSPEVPTPAQQRLAATRLLMQQTHPDKGGVADDFIAARHQHACAKQARAIEVRHRVKWTADLEAAHEHLRQTCAAMAAKYPKKNKPRRHQPSGLAATDRPDWRTGGIHEAMTKASTPSPQGQYPS